MQASVFYKTISFAVFESFMAFHAFWAGICFVMLLCVVGMVYKNHVLKAEREKYRQTFLNANDALFIMGKHGIREVNPRALALFGYDRHEALLGKTPLELSPEYQPDGELSSVYIESYFRRVESGERLLFPWQHKRADGSVFDAEVSLSARYQNSEWLHYGIVRDVTVTKQAQTILAESESNYRAIFNGTEEAIWIHDPETAMVLDVNATACRMLGIDYETALQSSPEDYSDEESSLERAICSIRAAASGESQHFEWHARTSNGGIIPVDVILKRIVLNEKTRVMAVIQDTTERKEAEQALRLSRERYRLVFDNAPVGIALLKRNGVFLRVNKAIQRILKSNADAMIGHDSRKFFAEEGESQLDYWLKTLVNESAPMIMGEIRWQKERNEVAWGKITLSKNRAHLEQEGEFIMVLEEVTWQKRTEHELMELRSFLKTVIDSMPSSLICFDPDLGITQLNQHALDQLGSNRHDVEQKTVCELFPALIPYKKSLRHVLTSHTTFVKRGVRWRANEGSIEYADLVFYPLEHGGLKGGVVRIDDATARVRLEENMVVAEKMMSAGGLAAGMAHEINNPLGVILQSAQNASRRLSSDFDQNIEAAKEAGVTMESLHDYLSARRIPQFIEDIRLEAIRISEIVDNLLQFCRQSPSDKSVTDIDDIVDRTLRLAENDYDLRKHYNFQNITFHRTKGEALPRVRVIVNQIEQVILNLLKNGAYAMKELDEAKRFFVIETWANSGMVHLRIADNGPGVDENIRRRVFEPFFTTKPIGEGIGLGLAVSYMIIVNNHNGLISCEPAEHQSGAAFMLSLPIVDEAS